MKWICSVAAAHFPGNGSCRVSQFTFPVEASTHDDAYGKACRITQVQYPAEDGWKGHIINIASFDDFSSFEIMDPARFVTPFDV